MLTPAVIAARSGALVIAVMFGMYTVKNEPSYLWIALRAASRRRRLPGVCRRLLQRDARRRSRRLTTIGRVSGFGWSMGYFGGIFLLLICYVGFIAPMSAGSG